MVKGTGHAGGRHGKGRVWKRGLTWWVQYYDHGKQIRESSQSDKKAVAEALLMKRLVGAVEGTLPSREIPITYEELRQRLVTKRQLDQSSLSRQQAEAGLKHLDAAFGGMKASAITEDRIDEFKVARQATGASNATINRSLAALRQMFRLSAKRFKNPPDVKLLPEPPARKGFLTREEYMRLWVALPEYVRPITAFGYNLGMRLGELKGLSWQNVNFAEGRITLDADQTKSGEARVIPFGQLPELAAILSQLPQRAASASCLVFTRASGRPLCSFRKAWIRACIRSGLGRMLWECPLCHRRSEVAKQSWPPERQPDEMPRCAKCEVPCRWRYAGLIFHDLRRTAVRNLRRAGVPESVAMKISGHKTREVFERYNIVDERDVVQAMEKLEGFQRAEDQKLERPVTRPN